MSDTIHEFTVQDNGERFDKVVMKALPNLTRNQVQFIIEGGHATVNGKASKSGAKMRGGELVRVVVPKFDETVIQGEDIPLHAYYEDEYIAVIEKPAGLVVHPAVGNYTGTLVNALLNRYPELQSMGEDEDIDEDRVGLVHRLDKDTSGLMVIARTGDATRKLSEQFQNREVDKIYLALTERSPKTLTGIIEAPVGRDPKYRKRMSVQSRGRAAKSQFEVVDNNFRDGQTLLKVTLFTGRTHQIRVHLAFIGCPVVGDALYGFRKQRLGLDRHFLHATHLAFNHPITGERLGFDSPLPEELENVLALLR